MDDIIFEIIDKISYIEDKFSQPLTKKWFMGNSLMISYKSKPNDKVFDLRIKGSKVLVLVCCMHYCVKLVETIYSVVGQCHLGCFSALCTIMHETIVKTCTFASLMCKSNPLRHLSCFWVEPSHYFLKISFLLVVKAWEYLI